VLVGVAEGVGQLLEVGVLVGVLEGVLLGVAVLLGVLLGVGGNGIYY
jgi:hypothetical protein